jgi:hypothetical protein
MSNHEVWAKCNVCGEYYDRRESTICCVKTNTIVSYGGGVDSTAMLIGLRHRGVKVDWIMFADTGGEHPETYAYIQYFNLWLKKNGFPEITIVKYRTKDGEEITLEQDVLNNNTLPAIAFGWKTCSQKFKIAPVDKFLKEYVIQGDTKPIKFIGFEAGEERRMKPDPNEVYENKYPLIKWGWDRKKCKEVIEAEGLCLPPKSSCWFCPNMSKHEVLALPDDFKERAMIMEANATKVAELKGLGRQFSWTDLINADRNQLDLFEESDYFQNPCECID